MKFRIKDVQYINLDRNEQFEIELPSNCPLCKTAVKTEPIFSRCVYEKDTGPSLFVVYFCDHCENCYIGYYSVNNHYVGAYNDTKLISFLPKIETDEKQFPENITKVSPNFCEIYNQSYSAQQKGLLDICGMGYRKALEFLVKDYAIFLNPNDADKIKNMLLAQCIKEYIDNRKIKNLATASAWLGNDETHYLRKHQEYNVDDLVVFIEATVSFISSDLSAETAEKLIKSKNSQK